MKFFTEKVIFFVLFFIYASIVIFLYFEQEKHVVREAEKRIDTILKFNKALHKYVEETQKPVIYDLKSKGIVYMDFFDPKILSFTYIARNIHNNYIEIETKDGVVPYQYKLAATNPRNPINKATEYEASILKRFRNNEIDKFTDIIEEKSQKYLFRAMPISKSKDSCMLCHSIPDVAPKELVDMYGDKAGFFEKVGDIRAMISIKIPVSEIIADEKTRFIQYAIMIFVVFVIVYIFSIVILRKEKRLAAEIESNINKEKKTRAILDSSPSIIVLNNGKEIVDANKTFFEFFDKYPTLEEFKNEHECICDLFEIVDESGYVLDKQIHNIPWVNYLIENKNQIYKAAILKNGILNHFILKAEKVDIDKEFLVIVELVNITQEIYLEKQMKEKESILQRQAKIVSMGEMMGYIAHQWRQPLNVISSASTGIKFQKDAGLLNEESWIEAMDLINTNSQYLSQIINDFAGYAKVSDLECTFSVKESVNKAIRILDGILKSNNIIVDFECESNLKIFGTQNEFVHVVMNILNNAKDKLITEELEIKVVFIKAYLENEMVVVEICDNGSGIDESIKDKIFEPYFTTKHQSRGTGLGLFVVHDIVSKIFKGVIKVKNDTFYQDGKKYFGANFIIKIPQSV